MNDLYNKLDVEKDNYELENIVDNYLKYGILLLKARHVGENLGEDNIVKVHFEDFKKDSPVKLERYTLKHMV